MPHETREVTKVKIKLVKGQVSFVRVEFGQPHGEDMMQVVVESKDAPKASLPAALQALGPHALDLCELPREWGADADSPAHVGGMSVRHDDTGVGVVISCVKTLASGAAMSFNTPFVREANEHGPELSGDELRAVERVMAEALAYVDGKRAQGDLFNKAEARGTNDARR